MMIPENINTNTYFDKVICINLERRQDRWKQMLAELRKNNITNFERLLAVDGSKIPNKDNWLTGGRIACALSHAAALKKIIDNNWTRALILEDDALFTENYRHKFSKRIRHVPQDYDILYFAGNDPQIISKVNGDVYKISGCLSTGAYAATINFAKGMVEKISNPNDAVDIIYKNNTPNYNCYIFKAYLITQRPGFSDIENRFSNYSQIISRGITNDVRRAK